VIACAFDGAQESILLAAIAPARAGRLVGNRPGTAPSLASIWGEKAIGMPRPGQSGLTPTTVAEEYQQEAVYWRSRDGERKAALAGQIMRRTREAAWRVEE
jgi:hypothetical protein